MQIKSTIESIKTRYSCRAFTDKTPTDKDLQIIAESAVAAPSALNIQPWRVIISRSGSVFPRIGLSVLLGYADESGVKPPHEVDMGKVSWAE